MRMYRTGRPNRNEPPVLLVKGYDVTKWLLERAVSSTKARLPVRLVYYEACLSQADAFRREKYLKSGPGKRYLKNRLKDSLASLTG